MKRTTQQARVGLLLLGLASAIIFVLAAAGVLFGSGSKMPTPRVTPVRAVVAMTTRNVARTPRTAALTTPACPVHIVGKRIVDRGGHTVYRAPLYRALAAQVKCNGRTVWVLFHGGAESSQEAYIGVRSADGGRTWKLLLSEPYFGVRAPFTIDSYSGPWTIAGRNAAYFVGWCPACGYGTVSLTVTLDGGRHFRRYKIPKLTGFRGTGIRVVGNEVTITARSNLRTGPRIRKVTVEVH